MPRMIMIIPSFKCYLVLAGCLFAASSAGRLSADRIEPQSDQQSDSTITNELCLAEVISYSFRWTISNFSQHIEKEDEILSSSIFPSGENDKHKWQMSIHPNGDDDDTEDFLSVFVFLKAISSDVALPVRAKFKISIINSTNQDMSVHVRDEVDFKTLDDGWGSSEHIRRDILLDPASGMLPGDKLTLACKVDVYTGNFIEAPNTCRLPNDLGDIFESQLMSDVDIVVADREFKAHKLILAARSPVFRAMFSHDMQESQLNRLEVNDVEPEVFEQLLRYIYTGNSPWLESTIDNMIGESSKTNTSQSSLTMELLKAACKYQMDALRLTCEHHLYGQLSVDSIVDILSLVDQYEAVWLKGRAVEFAIAHGKELNQNGALKVLAKQSPEILADLLTKQWSATN